MRPYSSMRRKLRAWYQAAHRDLPWRRTRDPYRIWLSEIMLQQTRVAAATPYYERFLELYPTIEDLAAAPDEDVLAAWSGLGYYSRARNMLRAARMVAARGAFPSDYDGIRDLPGVGDYTAAAIASLAFGLPHAAIDGNVLRVTSRLLDERGDIGSSIVKGRLAHAAGELLDRNDPGTFNQAMMELGATLCAPRRPQCGACPLMLDCKAHAAGTAAELPVKLRKNESQDVDTAVVVVVRDGQVLLRRRPGDAARLAGFWELPTPEDLPRLRLDEPAGRFRHAIVNHNYRVEVFLVSAKTRARGFEWVPLSNLCKIPVTSMARKAIQMVSL